MSVREIVGVACLAALFLGLLLWRRTRGDLIAVVAALFAAPIMITLGILTFYLTLGIAGLHQIGLWQFRDWSLTLYWLVGSAFLTAITTKEMAERPLKLAALLKETFTVAVALQFVAGSYSLPWLGELLLVPVIAFLAIVAAIAEKEARTRSVAVLAYGLLAGIGLLFLYNGAASAIAHWSDFATVETVRVFFLPVALAVMFAPARVALANYMTLERLYNGSRMRTDNKGVRRYAMARALFAFGFDHARVARFYRGAGPDTFLNSAHVDARIVELKERMRREANPPPVDAAEGWSPYVASRYLATHGLTAHDYRPLFTLWQANSKPLAAGSDRFSAFIEYYVEGDERVAGRLRLSGCVELRLDTPGFRDTFRTLAAALTEAAIGEAAARAISSQFERGTDFEFSASERALSFHVDDRAVAGGGARELEFFIDCKLGYDPHSAIDRAA